MERSNLSLAALLLVIFAVGASDASARNCPNYWVDGTFVDMGCFLFNTTASMTLEEASQYCQGVENASLIEIHTQEQLDFFKMERFVIEGSGARKSWWLGGTDRGREGRWFWMNSLLAVEDFVWWQTQPSGGLKENCMYTTVDAGISFWDTDCTEMHYPVCQRQLV